MLGRYLGIALMTLLICLWLASGAYGFVLLGRTKAKAASLQLGTQTVRKDLEATEPEDSGSRAFPEGQIARMIQADWVTAVPGSAFPRGLSTQPPSQLERSHVSR